jgi:hypothetical protein
VSILLLFSGTFDTITDMLIFIADFTPLELMESLCCVGRNPNSAPLQSSATWCCPDFYRSPSPSSP